NVVIRFGAHECFPAAVDIGGLAALSGYLTEDEILIHVSLGIATGEAVVWGCDLTEGYVHINADYTT
ncbi:MAG TPA: bifunctional ornithine acetyltransferase/N-acetylglutamate synthase, partial [Ilumatobacteraceae bacterium]